MSITNLPFDGHSGGRTAAPACRLLSCLLYSLLFLLPTVGVAADSSPADGSPADGSPADGSPADGSPADGSPADGSPADGSPADGSPADGSPADGSPADGSPADGSPAEANPARAITHAQATELRGFLEEVLERNPELQATRARVDVLSHRPDQAGALPDPTLQTTLFALPPETRVGPQRLQVGVQQRLPSKARRDLASKNAELTVRAAEADVRAAELRLATEARELWLELAFVDALRDILREERGHLERHEESARARYAAGTGLAQGAIKLQAELTRVDAEILGIDARRRSLVARLDALRDRFPGPDQAPYPVALPDVDTTALGSFGLESFGVAMDFERLSRVALAARPEVDAAMMRSRQAGLGEELAETNRKPDFTVGLAWTLVDSRQDTAGRVNPPEDDGRDVLALTGGMTLPLWSTPREGELREALARTSAAAADAHRVASEIRREVADLVHRLPLEVRQLKLLRDVLERQAEEAVTSAVSAYATGQTQVLDLLDAEHRLFEVRRAVVRAHADVAIALAKLEGAIAAPLGHLTTRGEGEDHD